MIAKRIKKEYKTMGQRVPKSLYAELNKSRIKEGMTWPRFLEMLLNIYKGGLPKERL